MLLNSSMNFWNQAPFVRLLFPFITGILLAIQVPLDFHYLMPITLFLFSIFLLIPLLTTIQFNFRYRWIYGILINMVLLLLGYQMTLLKTEIRNTKHFSKMPMDSSASVYVKIIKPYVEKNKSFKILAEIKAVSAHVPSPPPPAPSRGGNIREWLSTSGKALLYFQKDSLSEQLKYGDCLIIKTLFTDIKPPQNPSEFNLKQYLFFHNIYQQGYVPNGNWKLLNRNTGNVLIKYSIIARDKLLNILKINNINGDEYAVGSALLLGYEDKLEPDLIMAYSRTGAMHILSVSGLHVAIVYIVFNMLLFFLDKIKYGHIIKAIILLLLLWFYAALTGLSPSVLRATAMLSFVAVAKSFNRYTNIYNTLAASAFVLLLIDPNLIMNVGFLLSYFAVVGIVFLHPKIYDFWEPDLWLMDKIWILISVSLAAQIATFPMGLYYFHQFPNYFLFSNLIVIPISTLIIYIGILLFVFSSIIPLASILAKTLSFTIWILNSSVKIIEHLPYAVAQNISIGILESTMIYVLIAFLFAFIFSKRTVYLISSLSLIIVLLVIHLAENYKENRQKKIIVYNIQKTAAYDFIEGKQNTFLSDSSLINNESSLLFHVKPNWCSMGVDKSVLLNINKISSMKQNNFIIKNKFIQFYSTKIAILDSGLKKSDGKINVDYLILSKNAKFEMRELLSQYNIKKIIIDSSIPQWKSTKWKVACSKLKIDCYSVTESGAFEVVL